MPIITPRWPWQDYGRFNIGVTLEHVLKGVKGIQTGLTSHEHPDVSVIDIPQVGDVRGALRHHHEPVVSEGCQLRQPSILAAIGILPALTMTTSTHPPVSKYCDFGDIVLAISL